MSRVARSFPAALLAAAAIFVAAPADRAMAQTGPTTPVNIPDTNLRAALEAHLGKAAGATITRAEMAAHTGSPYGSPPRRTLRLDHADWNSDLIPTPSVPATVIEELTGLEYLTAIQGLSMTRNRITDLRPLAGLTGMRRLWLDENLISDLSPLRGLPLDQLSIKLNPVSDLSPLAGMVELANFNCDRCQISDISPLAGLTRLTSLDLQNNYIRSIEPLRRVNDLAEVFLSDNDIEDLSPLENRNLRTLTAAGNRITDLSPLRNSLAMETLDLNRNEGLRDISVVERMVALKVLRLDGTDVRDLSPLVRNAGLGSGDQVYLRNLPNLNADAEQHVATLRGRGVYIVTNTPLRLDRTVRDVRVTPGVERLTVDWTRMEPAPEFTPRGYRVYWWSGRQDRSSRYTPPQHHDATADTSSYTIPNLTPGTRYNVQILPYPPWPGGEFSAIAAGTPYAALRVVGEGEGEAVTVTPGVESLAVSWNPVDGAGDYKVQWKSGDEDYDPDARQARTGGGDKTSHTIPDLTAGTEYTVRVIAVTTATDDGADGPPSDEATGTPLAPGGVGVDEEVRSLEVSWERVEGATSYQVQWRRTAAAEEFAAADAACVYVGERGACGAAPRSGPAGDGDEVTWTITGLEPGIEYTVRVTPMRGDRRLGVSEGTGTPKAAVTIMGEGAGASVGKATAAEGEDAVLAVMLDESSDVPVTVEWRTEDDDTAKPATRAKADEDYAATSGRLTFAPGQVRMALTVSTEEDRRVEPDETFRVRLIESDLAAPDPEAASAIVTIEDDDTAPMRRRALGMALSGMGRWIAADAVDAIGERFAGREAAEAQVSLGGRMLPLPGIGPQQPAARSAAPARADERMPWTPEKETARPALSADSLYRSRFNLPLGAGAGAGAGAGGTPDFRVWGRGSTGGFDGRPQADFRMDGDMAAGYVGLDWLAKRDVLLGMAVAVNRGDVDYAIDDVTTGEVDLNLTSLLPYAHWRPRADLGVWGLLGAGWGDVGLEDEAGEVGTGLTMRMAAAGLRQDAARWREIDVAVKADAFLVGLKTAAREGLPKAAGDASRLRLLLEGRMPRTISPVSQVTPSLEVGGRWDGGDAGTGMGVEVGGGLSYEHDTLGLEVEARGRTLLTRRKSWREWGMSLAGTLDPGLAGRGPWMKFALGWGAEGGRAAQMWGGKGVFRARGGADEATELSPDRLNLETGWGLATHGGAGLLTPWAGLSMAGSETPGYALGVRMKTGRRMSLSVENRRSKARGWEVMLRARLDR